MSWNDSFSWLTTEKSVGLIAIISAAIVYWFGAQKRNTEESLESPAKVRDIKKLHSELDEIREDLRRSDRNVEDLLNRIARTEHTSNASMAILVQIRDELHLIRTQSPRPKDWVG